MQVLITTPSLPTGTLHGSEAWLGIMPGRGANGLGSKLHGPHSHTIALIHTRSPSYPRLRLSRQVDELFVFSSRGQGGPVRLADTYTGEWLDTRRLTLNAINARVTPGAVSGGDSQAAPTNLLQGGSSPLSASECL